MMPLIQKKDNETKNHKPPAKEFDCGIEQFVIFMDNVPPPEQVGWFRNHMLREKPDTGPKYLRHMTFG